MKIGIFDPYLDTLGGGERYMLTMADCLASDHAVSIFWNDPEMLEKATKRFGLDLRNVALAPNIFSQHTSQLQRLSQTRSFDRIIILSDGSIPVTLAKKSFLHFQMPMPGIKLGISDRVKLKRVAKVIVNSQYTKRFIDKTLGVESVVLYPPVSIGSFSPDEKKENVILTVGRYNHLSKGSSFKKQEVLVKAFKQLVDTKKITGWKFIIVTNALDTEKGYIEELKKQIKGYPIEIKLDLPHREYVRLMNSARIYWHAAGFGEDLEKHPERAEHFGISTVEAMAAGCVSVVINAGGQPEIVDDKENGYIWNSLEELDTRTRELVENKEMLKNLSVGAVKRSKDFTEELFCRQLREILR